MTKREEYFINGKRHRGEVLNQLPAIIDYEYNIPVREEIWIDDNFISSKYTDNYMR